MTDTLTPAQERMARARAAKAVKSAHVAEESIEGVDVPEGWLKVRILKLGDGKIFTGETNPVNEWHEKGRFPTYARNELAYMAPHLVATYEDRGWVEAVD